MIDYPKSALSVLIATISDLGLVIRVLWPQLTLLISFGMFVIWNGGVVLGKIPLSHLNLLSTATNSNARTVPFSSLRKSTVLCSDDIMTAYLT